jgi:hypothetical protein
VHPDNPRRLVFEAQIYEIESGRTATHDDDHLAR